MSVSSGSSSQIAPCLLCGCMILDIDVVDNPTWLNQFLYTDNGRISISGVGYFMEEDGNGWVVPPDYESRWGDEEYSFPANHRIGVLRQNDIDGRYGVPFHEACWSLIEAVHTPEKVPLRRLFNLCRSYPILEDSYAPDWGHAYGGLSNEHPDDGLCIEAHETYTDHQRLCVYKVAKINPYYIPALANLPKEPPESPPGDSLVLTRSRDCFSRLPEEVCVQIASLLKTADFLAARLASSSFTVIFHRPQFWASRFAPTGERSWVFEARGWDRAVVDWRTAWLRTSFKVRTPAMQNRWRLWLLARQIRSALWVRYASPSGTTTASLSVVSDDSVMTRVLASAGGPLARNVEADQRLLRAPYNPYRDFDEGCVELETRAAALPESARRITIYGRWLFDTDYVVGIRIEGECGAVVELGYMAGAVDVPILGKKLTGFNLAVESRGVKAIQCVFDGKQVAPWVGSLSNTSMTMRLSSLTPLLAISAGFDGCKMVGLRVASKGFRPNPSVRETAQWLNDVPDPELCLHEDGFSDVYQAECYDPVDWALFGGARGSHLQYLTGIHVSLTMSPCHIEFDYAHDRLAPFENMCRDLGAFPSSSMARMSEFEIDGPAGERVTAVEVFVRHEPDDEPDAGSDSSSTESDAFRSLESFKLSTNWGRSHHFQYRRLTPRAGKIVGFPVQIAPGATITGFYCTIHAESIVALGVISEMLDQD